jgi:hypothetical protein
MIDLRFIALVSLVSACGGGAPPAPPVVPTASRVVELPVKKRGDQKLIARVGHAGGTLELDNGARLDIPAGALSDEVELTFAEGTRTTAFANRDHERPLGPTLEMTPELPLASPIRVSIPLRDLPEGFDERDVALGVEQVASLQRAVGGGGTQTRWDYVPATSTGGRAAAELSQLNGLRVQFVVSKSE